MTKVLKVSLEFEICASSKPETMMTQRKHVIENMDMTFLIDPALHTFLFVWVRSECGRLKQSSAFQEKKERPLVIVDPYAGVGPSMALLYTEENLVSNIYVNDMNPEAIPYWNKTWNSFIREENTKEVT